MGQFVPYMVPCLEKREKETAAYCLTKQILVAQPVK